MHPRSVHAPVCSPGRTAAAAALPRAVAALIALSTLVPARHALGQGLTFAEPLSADCAECTFEAAQAAAGAPEVTPEERLVQLERAVRLARSPAALLGALDAYGETLAKAGNGKRAAAVRREAAALRAAPEGKARPLLLAVGTVRETGRAFVVPLAYGGARPAPLHAGDFWESQYQLTRLAATYLVPGRRYRYLGDGGAPVEGGLVVEEEAPELKWEVPDGCFDSSAPGVAARPEGAPGELRGFATDGDLHPIAPGTRRPLADEEGALLASLVAGKAQGKVELVPFGPAQELGGADFRPRARPSLRVQGFAQDLDGDGALELVAAVRVQLRRQGPVKRAFLVVRPGASRPILRHDAVGDGIQILGTVDLNGDGVDDIMTSSWGYEYGTHEIWVSTRRGGYVKLLVSAGGC
jgi:hypothetical protein